MKNELRKKLFDIRANIKNRDEKETLVINKVLEFISENNFNTILSYVSMRCEVDTKGIIEHLKEFSDINLLIPFTIGSSMKAVVYEGEELTVDKIGNVFGIEDKPEFVKNIELSITPLLGFNEKNHRIGYGKGCYDQYYARHTIQNKIGIAFDEQEIEFERDKFDIPLDIIFTPTRILKLRSNK
ncbi:MAG: 5-formyltetrahydrofolate cyclo-ligase [Firmicutes bacterium]|nr:5-formyltetrahydrofolate cyclo-ligase [Bacillota bacterium]